MTEQEKPQKWGSKERMALVAEVLRQKRMVEWLSRELARRRYVPEPDACHEGCRKSIAGCTSCWNRFAEQAVADEILPKT